MAVADGAVIPAGTTELLLAGSDYASPNPHAHVIRVNSDGSIDITPTALSTASFSSTPANFGTVTIASADPTRKKLIMFNNSRLGFMYYKTGAGCTTTDCTSRIGPMGTVTLDWDGIVTAIWTQSNIGEVNTTSLGL